jgi:hypothetical protein
MQDLDKARVTSGDRLKTANGFEFALVRPGIAKFFAKDHLERAIHVRQLIACEKDFAVTALSDTSKQKMVGNDLGQFKGPRWSF